MSGKKKFTIGIDFGENSASAILVNVSNGKLVASTTNNYPHGIITDKLPGTDIELGLNWALQHPSDYINALKRTVPKLLKESQIQPEQIIGIGISFQGSTLIPTLKDGTPLALIEDYKNEPHAWPKHWTHFAAREKAEQLTQIAIDRLEIFLDRYGGRINSDWFFPKVWEIFDESLSIYNAADRLIEASDWLVWQLTGVESRSLSTAGFKALWSKQEGFPLETFFGVMHPTLTNVVSEKMMEEVTPVGVQVGELSEIAANWMKLIPGIPVSTGMLSNYAAVPAATVTEPGKLVLILDNLFSHLVLSNREFHIPGIHGMVEDGIIPGLNLYEAGQASGFNQLTWFMENSLPRNFESEARKRKVDLYTLIEEKAMALEPAQSGLVALDWWNGTQSILQREDLRGLLLGFSLKTKPEEIYRTLIEASAFGTRKIFETFIASGMAIDEIIVTNADPGKNRLLLNILANVSGMEIKVAESPFASALGAAMFASVAAGEELGGYATIEDASSKMARLKGKTFIPNNADKQTYNRLYSEYTQLHDYFGYEHNNVMIRLKNQRDSIFEKKLRLLQQN